MDHNTGAVLPAGPFHEALGQAIRARGLTLERLRAHLATRGITLSTATLSYWQTGRRQPERQDSIEALIALEGVLRVPAGSLITLLPPPRPRGRPPADQSPGAPLLDLWPLDELPRLATYLRMPEYQTLRYVAVDDRVELDADGIERVLGTRQVMRATAPTLHFFDISWVEHPDAQAPDTTFRGASKVDHRWHPESGYLVAKLEFDHELAPDETVIVDRHRRYHSHGAASEHTRAFWAPVSTFIAQATFDPARRPRRCFAVRAPNHAEPLEDIRELTLNTSGEIHAVFTNATVGVWGLRWDW
ncbi:helix-turn-helix domain-containing protein [Actinokineospora xionganensis]|uniref:XRE family transcriptional regulator n=1 Tax=Actinokineospora xionganensis TaxID=2684470 RepID=A0ABR7L5P0_9PSEU|nr:hypothetical protein [Actinokineospora xionganensis]MBC6447980.1 hypothetical protein [Actinokineospora xionganensis]